MVVSAVNGVKFNTHRANITFGGEAETAPKQTPKRAGNFVKVPVIVMMTLSPSLLNGAGASAENYQDDFNYPQTELLAMATPEPQSYVSSTKRQSTFVRPQIVQYQKTFTSGGVQYTMYYTNPNKEKDPNTKYVRDVYFVPKGFAPTSSTYSSEEQPPRLAKIRLHEISGGNSFVGAIVEEKKADQNWYKKEIKLPDEIAGGLMDLVKGRTNLKVVEGGTLDRMFGGANMEYTKSSELIREQYLK